MDKRGNQSDLRRSSPDFILIVCTVLLVAIGIVMIYSSSNYHELQYSKNSQKLLNDTYRWVAIGSVIFVLASLIKYTAYKKFRYMPVWIFFGLTTFMLIYVFTQPAIRDVHRWIVVGGLQFQPSEFVKLSTIFVLAAYLEKYNPWDRVISQKFAHFFLLTAAIVCVAMLIYIEPNKSTAVVVGAIAFGILFVDGLNVFLLVGVSALGIAGMVAHTLLSKETLRLQVFLGNNADVQEAAWQINQSLIAFGAGGITGVGLGNGTQNKLYLSEGANDFILGNIGEEFGFIGVVGLLILYIILIYRCFLIAMKAPDRFSALISAGVGIMLTVHVLLNYMVTTAMLPTTGVTLPLVSYGGTSTIVFLGALGVVCNISCYRQEA